MRRGQRKIGGNRDPVDKSTLIGWVNYLLSLHYDNIDQLANGAAFCQLFDAIQPGKIQLKRVNFSAKYERDKLANYSILQEALIGVGIALHLEAAALARGSYMSLLELLQWFYRYWQAEGEPGIGTYNAVERREQCGLHVEDNAKPARRKKGPVLARPGARAPRPAAVEERAPSSGRSGAGARERAQSPLAMLGGSGQRSSSRASGRSPLPSGGRPRSSSGAAEHGDEGLREEIRVMELQHRFYYDKLVRLETLLLDKLETEQASRELIDRALEIMYATDEPAGFITPGDLGT